MRGIPAFVVALIALFAVHAPIRGEGVASAPRRLPPTRPAPQPAGPVLAEPLPEPAKDNLPATEPPVISATPTLPPETAIEPSEKPLPAEPRIKAQPRIIEPTTPLAPDDSPRASVPPAAPAPDVPASPAVPVKSWFEAQIELARRGFSSGSIDAAVGPKTRAALRAFQQSQLLMATGELDRATKSKLTMTAPAIAPRTLTAEEIESVQPLAPTWLGKSLQTVLSHETVLELAAEKYHAHPLLLKKLNPTVDWTHVTPQTELIVPAIDRVELGGQRAAQLEIRLADCVLEARDAAGKIIAHFPVSIGRLAETRPAGELHVTVVIPDPNYTFDPAVFPESAEARELGRKLILQPGPNNPVGVVWIGLDRPGYGIHGTPSPERVGSAESHGCFRLANWDARTLRMLAWTGLPVEVIAPEPATAGNG